MQSYGEQRHHGEKDGARHDHTLFQLHLTETRGRRVTTITRYPTMKRNSRGCVQSSRSQPSLDLWCSFSDAIAMDTGAFVNSPGTRKALLSLSILLSLLCELQEGGGLVRRV